MTTSSKSLADCFKTFTREAFRLETLDDYSQSGGVQSYQDFLAGRPQSEDFKSAAWLTTVADAVASGKRMYRVHVLARPLTDYLRYELGWGYRRNMKAGEEFFILDITDQENPIPQAPDFWLFDEQIIGAMKYDGRGKFLGADFLGGQELATFLSFRDKALAQAVPFADWWAEHGE